MPVTATNGTDDKFLWKGVYKLNHDDGGFTYTVWVPNVTEANARTAIQEIGVRIRRLLPGDAEIYDCLMYRWDNKRNGAYVNGTFTVGATAMTPVGAGLYGTQLASPAPTECDNPRSCVKLRMEDDGLFVVPRKFNIIPDSITAGGLVTSPPAPVVGRPLAAPTGDALTDVYAVQFNLLMQALAWYTCHVVGMPTQGGNYKYDLWKNVFLRKVGVKKGGHVFIS